MEYCNDANYFEDKIESVSIVIFPIHLIEKNSGSILSIFLNIIKSQAAILGNQTTAYLKAFIFDFMPKMNCIVNMFHVIIEIDPDYELRETSIVHQ